MPNLNHKQYSFPVTIYKLLTTENKTDIGTIPQMYNAYTTMFHFCNIGDDDADVSMEIYSPILNETIHIMKDVKVKCEEYLTLSNVHLFLCPGDIFRVTADEDNTIAVTISYDALYDPNATHGSV